MLATIAWDLSSVHLKKNMKETWDNDTLKSLHLIIANHPPSLLLGDSPFTSIDIYCGYRCVLEEIKAENIMLTCLIHVNILFSALFPLKCIYSHNICL